MLRLAPLIHCIAWIAAHTAVGALRITAAEAVDGEYHSSCLTPEITRNQGLLGRSIDNPVNDAQSVGGETSSLEEIEIDALFLELIEQGAVDGAQSHHILPESLPAPFSPPVSGASMKQIHIPEGLYLPSKEPLPTDTIDEASRRIDGYVIGTPEKYSPEMLNRFRTRIKPFLGYQDHQVDLSEIMKTKYKALTQLSFDPHATSESRLLTYYGDRIKSHEKIGQGGFSDVYKVCGANNKCWVAKVRMVRDINRLNTAQEVESAMLFAHAILMRDIAAGEMADNLFQNRITFNGKKLPVKVLKIHDTASLSFGIAEMDLIPLSEHPLFPNSKSWQSELARAAFSLQKSNKPINRNLARQLTLLANQVSSPELLLINLFRIERVKDLIAKIENSQNPIAISLGKKILSYLNLPSDHEDIVMAIEQAHRLSADEITQYFGSQKNLSRHAVLQNTVHIRTNSNQNQRKKFIINVGLDLNHGVNFGYQGGTYYNFDR